MSYYQEEDVYSNPSSIINDGLTNSGFDENTWKIVTADDPRTDVDRVILRGVDENAQFDSAERLEIADTDLDEVVAGTSNAIEITAFDFAGEPDTNAPITVVDADGVTGLTADATTNDSGVATFTLTETIAGTYTITFANADKPDISNTASVTVVADSVGATGADGSDAGSISEVTKPSSGAGVTGIINVSATDRFGNPVAGANLSVASNASLGGLANGTTVTTNDSGVATLEFTETRAGSYDVELVDESGTVTQTVRVTVTNHPDGVSGGDGGNITVDGPTTTSAGQQQVFEVIATDVYGNRVGGENISVTAPTGIAGLADTVTTNESGVARFKLTGELVGDYEIEFSDETGGFTETANLTVDPDSDGLSGGDGGTISAVAPPEAAAGQTGVIELNVTDQFGNLLPNETVIVAKDGGLGGLATDTATTSNSSGVATFEFNETNVGDYEVAFADDTFGNPILLPGESIRGTETVTVSNDPAGVSGGTGGEITITTTQVSYDRGRIAVTATDQYGNPVVGETLSVGNNSEIGDPALTAETNADGVAEITFTETTAGDYSLTVADESGAITDTALVEIAPHSDGVSGGTGGTITAETTAKGDSTSTVEITAMDAAGNRVVGETIRISDDGGVGGLDGVTAKTNDTGVATMRISGTVPGDYTLTFADDSGTIDDTASMTVAANSEGVAGGDGGQLTAPASQTATADQELTITVDVTDENGVRVPNENITVTDAAGIADLEGVTAVTNESGIATFTFSQNVTGDYDITLADQSGAFTTTTTATVSAHSEGVSSGGNITGTQTRTPGGTGITVNPTDTFGNPVGGEAITITDADGISELEGARVVTNSDGEAIFNFSGVQEGEYNVTVEAGGISRPVPISVTANSDGVSGGQGGVVSAPAPPATRAGQTSTVNITATDESGVFVPNERVRIQSTDGLGGLSSGATVETNADGVASFQFNETRAGNYTVEFTDESGEISSTTTVSVTADSEGAVESGEIANARTLVGIAGQEATLELLATDRYGNPVPNTDVTITSPRTELNGKTATTDSSGVAVVSYTETEPGKYPVEVKFVGAKDSAKSSVIVSVYENLNVDRGPDDDGSGGGDDPTSLSVKNDGAGAYIMDGEDSSPTIELERGETYEFHVDAVGHPFYIGDTDSGGNLNGVFTDGVTVSDQYEDNDGVVETGTLTIEVPEDAPDSLRYHCGIHSGMTGEIDVVDGSDDDGSTSPETDTHLIHGTVTHSNGVRADGGRVTVVKADGSHRQNVLIDADGNYEVAVPAGNYRVIVDRPGSPRAIEEVNAAQANPDPAHLTLNNPATIVGSVTDQQKAAANLPVQIGGEGRTYYSKTNNSGTFELDVPPGTYVVAPLGNGAGLGSREVTVTEGDLTDISVDLQPQTIDDDPELRIVDGPGNLSVDGHEMVVIPEIKDGLLQVQIANKSDPGRNTSVVENPSELEGFGVTENTVFEITVTVENYTPHTLFWALRDAEFTAAQNPADPTATDITIRGSPVELATTSAQQKRVGPMVDEDPAEVLWPSSDEDTADATYNQTVIFSIYDLSTEPEAVQNRLTGMILTTNAQQISLPEVRDNRLRTWIAAPRFEQPGVTYEGFYQATIPEGQLDEWGVDSAEHQLFAEYKSTDRELTVESVDDGISVDVSNISYSASYVDIRADSTAPVPDDTGSGNQNSVGETSPPAASDSGSAGGTGGGSGGSTVSTGGAGTEPSPGVGDETVSGGTAAGGGPQSNVGSSDNSEGAKTTAGGNSGSGGGAGGSGGAGGAGGSGGGGGGGGGGGSGGGAGGAVGVLLASITAPVRWFGSLSTAGKAAVTVTSSAGAAGAAYSFGGDRIQTPTNMARRRLQSWLRRRLRGSTRQQLTRLVTSLRKRLAWSNIRARLAALRKYFTRSYWREWFENRRELATREGLQAFLIETYRSYRKRQWRGWLRSRLRGGVDAASGGLITTLIPGWLAPVSGPVGTALSVVVAEIQRWIEDIVMGKFDALGKRYSTLMLRSSALLTDTTDRLWYAVTGENPPASNPSVSSIAGEHAAALREVGIESVDQLAAADPDHLENTVEVSSGVIDGWIEQAQQRGAKADRPPIAETQNGKRVRRWVDRLTDRATVPVAAVVARVGGAAEPRAHALRARSATAETWLREDGLPAVVSPARHTTAVIRRSAARGSAQVRLRFRRITVRAAERFGTTGGDLQSIDGIGSAYHDRLSEAEITTVTQLATADPERLAGEIEVSPKRVHRWTTHAVRDRSVVHQLRRRLLIQAVRMGSAVTDVRTANSVSLPDILDTRAWAVVETTEEIDAGCLSAVGVGSVQQLAAANPVRLAGAVDRDVEVVADWVDAAQTYERYVIYAPPERFSR